LRLPPVILIGLTGGIGTGKSASSDWLQSQSVPVADTDLIARELVAPGQSVLSEIAGAFGNSMLNSVGALDRAALARVVFADVTARHRLEQMLHPRIRAEWKARVAGWRDRDSPLAAVVIPLLFETGAEAEFDLIVCTACTPATQQRRLEARGWSTGEIQGRLASQWPLEEKLKRSDVVLWTEGALELIGAQWRRMCDRNRRPLFPSS